MRTIGQVLDSAPSNSAVASPLLPNYGGIGIELELESEHPFRDVRGWRRTPDGSLRDGVEYIFDGAQAGAQALESIQAMGSYLAATPADPSFRCSTHIHMDVRDLEFHELERLVATYALYENVFFDHCSPERRYSNFCTPFFINDALVRMFVERFKTPAGVHEKVHHLSAWPKYSALNLKVTPTLGSVEFRGSHALTTTEDLLALAQRMLGLKRLVKTVQADTSVAYVMALRHMPLAEAFPQGLRQGYAPNPEDQDIGFSNAMLIASSRWNYSEEAPATPQAPQGFSWAEAAARANTPRRRSSTECFVRVNPEAFAAYNVDVSILRSHPANSAYKSLIGVLRVYKALATIRGMAPPTLEGLLANPRELSELPRHYGQIAIDEAFVSANLNPREFFPTSDSTDF